jgi:hypothetical protein
MQTIETSRDHPDGTIGLAGRLTLWSIGVFCLIAMLLDSPVPMAIAP